MFNPYTKAILAAVLAGLTALFTAVEDGSTLTNAEIATAAMAFIGGLAVVWATHYAIKWVMSGVMAAGAALVTALQDGGISTQEYLTIAIAALTALTAVYAIPNTVKSEAPKVL